MQIYNSTVDQVLIKQLQVLIGVNPQQCCHALFVSVHNVTVVDSLSDCVQIIKWLICGPN